MKKMGDLGGSGISAKLYSLIMKGEDFQFTRRRSKKTYTVRIEISEPEIITKEDGTKWQRIG